MPQSRGAHRGKPAQPTQILDVRPDVHGAFATLACGCGARFERYQPTLAGVGVGQHACPGCGSTVHVHPEEFVAALADVLPEDDPNLATELTERASATAESWYCEPGLAGALVHAGVELGPPTERALLSAISLGILRARAADRP